MEKGLLSLRSCGFYRISAENMWYEHLAKVTNTRGFMNVFSRSAKLLELNSARLSNQLFKLSLQLFNLPCAWHIMKPLLIRVHECTQRKSKHKLQFMLVTLLSSFLFPSCLISLTFHCLQCS